MIRIAVLQNTHTLSERDIPSALERAGMQAHFFSSEEPQEKFADCHGFIITDGAKTPLINQLKEQSALGKPILGISKGAELLVETGLVPGIEDHQVGVTLMDNQPAGFYDARVHIRPSKGYQWNVFTRHLKPNTIMQVPLAHAKARFMMSSVLLAELKRNGQPIFQYCDDQGHLIDATGSIHSIAAVANKTGNVMAIMPHIERTLAGDAVFKSMHDYIKAGYVARPATLYYQPR